MATSIKGVEETFQGIEETFKGMEIVAPKVNYRVILYIV